MSIKGYKLFTLEEARRLLPSLRDLLVEANSELEELLESVAEANQKYEQCEKALDMAKSPKGSVADLTELRALRADFQEAIQALSQRQSHYVKRLNEWVEKITSSGVILRDLREGLLDFPARTNGFEYHLCWRLDENDISFWHSGNDGFVGRKPLAALSEYC
jgi:hypothetical protein